MSDTNKLPACGLCPVDWSNRACRKPGGKGPEGCPTLGRRKLVRQADIIMNDSPELLEFARQASVQEGECYGGRELGYARVKPLKPRIVEVIEFARKMKYGRIGLAFCVGLRKEAAVVHEIFEINSFEVVSVICKAGRVTKDAINIEKHEQVDPSSKETMCNPVLQAKILNDCKTEFNVLLGLCVGHDSLFIKHTEAMCTVLAVKDRLLGHNPLIPVYEYDSYYRYLKHPLP